MNFNESAILKHSGFYNDMEIKLGLSETGEPGVDSMMRACSSRVEFCTMPHTTKNAKSAA